MNKRIHPYLTGFLPLVLCLVFLSTACSDDGEKISSQQQSSEQQQEYEKAPKILKEMEANIEKIFETMKGPFVSIEENEKEKSEENQQQSSQINQEETQKNKSGGNEGSEGSGSENKSNGNGENKDANQSENVGKASSLPPDIWKKIDVIISQLHYQWNDFMPEAINKNSDPKISGNFSDALNILTNTAKSKDSTKVLTDANALYRSIFDLYSMYKTEMSPEIKRLRYLIRSVILYSIQGDWEQADGDTSQLNSSWAFAKNTLDKNQIDNAKKLDLSILELNKVVKGRNSILADIKGRIALSNIKLIEKYYEKNSG